jgi:hypothetical protein
MLGPGKIWGILIIIIILSTTISGFIWFYFYHSGDNKDSQNPEILIQKYHAMKSDLKEFKEKKAELSVTYEENIIGNGVRKYSDSQGGMMFMEIYERNSLVRISYNIIDDKKIDIIEYYNPESGMPDHTEYDVDSDGIFDIDEKDSNNDGIISVNEIKINIGGKFLPLGSLGIVAM